MKTKTLFLISNLLLFFFAGIAAFSFVNVMFTDAINEFRRFIDFLPFYVTLIIPIYALIAVNRIAKTDDENVKLRKIKLNGSILLITSLVCLIYGFINTFVSMDGDFLAGGPSKYFPLSFIILDIAFAAIIGYILYLFRDERIIHQVKNKLPVSHIVIDVLKHFYLLLALYFLGTFAFGFYSFDLSLEHVAGTLPIYLLMVVPSAFIIVYEIIKHTLSEDKRDKSLLILAISTVGASMILGIWMYIYKGLNPNFVVDSLTASFPLDFAISLNLGPNLAFALSLLPGLVLLLTRILLRYCLYIKHRVVKNGNQ